MATAATSPALDRQPRTANLALLMGASMALVDIFTLSCAVFAGFWFWSLIRPVISLYHPSMLLAVGFSSAAFGFYGLYPGIGMTAAGHMRSIAQSVRPVYLLLILYAGGRTSRRYCCSRKFAVLALTALAGRRTGGCGPRALAEPERGKPIGIRPRVKQLRRPAAGASYS
jgi:hypothetical protein